MTSNESVDIFDGLLRKFKLLQDGHDSTFSEDIVNSLYKITIEMRKKCQEIFFRVHDVLNNVDNDGEVLVQIIDGIFHREISWGRIFVTLALMIEVMEKSFDSTVKFTKYYDIFVNILKDRIHQWIITNGFWVILLSLNTNI